MPKQDGKLKELLNRVASTPGWEVSLRRSGHWRVVGPDGRQMSAPCTTGDRKSWYQVRLKLRRLGWPE